jgi:replicative DNA helicase
MDIKNDFGGRKYSELLKEGLVYIKERKEGKIKSFKTPWKSVNDSGVNGIEWNSLWTFASRPGAGKTMLTDQLARESRILNLDIDFNILTFQFEMGVKQYASRAFAAETALDYNTILSAYNQLEEFAYKQMIQFTKDCIELENKGVLRYVITKTMTHLEIEKAVHYYYELMGKKPLFITIDHSYLLKNCVTEREKITMLYNAGETFVRIKRELPVIIVVLSQLNRNIDNPERKVPNNIGNYPTAADILGSDVWEQCSDFVSILNRPYKSDIPVYGPNGYIMKSEDIAMHIIKSRNSPNESNIVFLKAEFDKGRAIECEPPLTSTVPNSFKPFRTTK